MCTIEVLTFTLSTVSIKFWNHSGHFIPCPKFLLLIFVSPYSQRYTSPQFLVILFSFRSTVSFYFDIFSVAAVSHVAHHSATLCLVHSAYLQLWRHQWTLQMIHQPSQCNQFRAYSRTSKFLLVLTISSSTHNNTVSQQIYSICIYRMKSSNFSKCVPFICALSPFRKELCVDASTELLLLRFSTKKKKKREPFLEFPMFFPFFETKVYNSIR